MLHARSGYGTVAARAGGASLMRILIADDEAVSRILLEKWLLTWGYTVAIACDGAEAWQILQEEDAPPLAILDWMMPAVSGLEICRRVRASSAVPPIYLILVTAKNRPDDIVTDFEAGADDYLANGFNPEELQARIRVGERLVSLQSDLTRRVRELETALSRVKQLEGLIPICSYCKKVRTDHDYWQQVEVYVMQHSRAQFSHGICPECYQNVLRELG